MLTCKAQLAPMAQDDMLTNGSEDVSTSVQRLWKMSVGSVLGEPQQGATDFEAMEDDDVEQSIWQAALKAPAVTITDLTQNFHEIYVDLKSSLLKDALAQDDTTEHGLQAWMRLLLVDRLLFHKGGAPGESLNGKLRARFQAARDRE